jgi:mono/diheme cytochrome c family protein
MTRTRWISLAALASLIAAPPAAGAQDVSAITRGLYYANRSCASCHAVAAGQKRSPNSAAPTFEAVANTPGMTAMALNVWLHTSHPTMPNLIINPDNIADLTAYIGSLKIRKPE